MSQSIQDHTADAISSQSRVLLPVVAFALFLDYFLYGLLFPLAAHSPAGVKSDAHLALLYGVYAVSVLLVTPLFGYLGDRLGSRSTMMFGAVLAVGAVSLLGGATNLSVILMGKFCQGAASAALWTSGLALIATNYAEKRVVMLGYAFTAGTLGSVTGPIAGGLLYRAAGYKLPFLLIGVGFALSAALMGFLPRAAIQRHDAVNFRALLANRSILVPAGSVALAAFSVGIIEPLLPVRLARYGLTSIAIGIMFTVSTLVYGFSSPVVGRVSERFPIQKVIVWGAIAMAAALPLLALVSGSIFSGPILIGLTLCLINVAYAFMLNPASAELGNVVDRSGMSCYSAVYAVYNIAYSVGMLGTAALASTAVRLLNFSGVLLSASAVLLLSVPLLIKAGPVIKPASA